MISKDISLYIHIPFCISKCSYCDFFSIACKDFKNAIPQKYIDALCNEINYRINNLKGLRIKTVYIGGGTPSLLSQAQIKQIVEVIKIAGLSKEYEFTFEINPDDLSMPLVECLNDCGVNRISCGVQSISEHVLKNVHRRASSEQNYKCISFLKNNFKGIVSADLICGLPEETEKTLIAGLDYLIKNKIPHISFYSLCVEEETPLGHDINCGKLEYDFDYSDELWIKGRDYLLSKGYLQYEVSNFCLPGYECLHNMAYWTHKNYLGCGSGATGTIENLRSTNTKNIGEYENFWLNNRKSADKIPQTVEKIEQKTSEFEFFMMGLRTCRGICPQEYKQFFGKDIPEKVQKKLDAECKKSPDGFYYLDKDRLLFLNSFIEDLLDLLD